MGLHNTNSEYGALAKWLHWLVAIGIFALIALGLQQAGMERGPEKSEIRFIHGSIAMLLLLLMTVRILWRWRSDVPPHPEGLPAWQKLGAHVVHWGIYIAVFVQLASGAMTVATGGRALPFFGLFSIPLPVAEDDDKHHFWEEIHEFAWKTLAILVAVHILAALYNQFVLKNDVLKRMTTGVT